MSQDKSNGSFTRRTLLKAGAVTAVTGTGLSAAGLGTAQNEESETYTLGVALIESRDAGVISGEVTVDGETKTTTPEDEEDGTIIRANFELEDGTYSVSGESDMGDETWRSNEQEVEIDGEDKNVALMLYPPDSDEFDEPESEDEDEEGTDGGDCPEEEPEQEEDDCPEEEPEPEPDCPEE